MEPLFVREQPARLLGRCVAASLNFHRCLRATWSPSCWMSSRDFAISNTASLRSCSTAWTDMEGRKRRRRISLGSFIVREEDSGLRETNLGLRRGRISDVNNQRWTTNSPVSTGPHTSFVQSHSTIAVRSTTVWEGGS